MIEPVIIHKRNNWNNIFVFPGIKETKDGISLSKKYHTYFCMIETNNGYISAFIFRPGRHFVYFKELEYISEQFTTTRIEQHDTIIKNLCLYFKYVYTSNFKDIEKASYEITEDMIYEEEKNPYSYRLLKTNIENEAKLFKFTLENNINLFCSFLNQDILFSMNITRIEKKEDIDKYNYMIHYNPKIMNHRKQVLELYPSLNQLLSSDISDYESNKIKKAIDYGNPIIPIISDIYLCDKKTVKYIIEQNPENIKIWTGELNKLIEIVNILIAEKYPKNKKDFDLLYTHINIVYESIKRTFQIKKITNRNNDVDLYFLNYKTLVYYTKKIINDMVKDGYEVISKKMEKNRVGIADLVTINDVFLSYVTWVEAASVDFNKIKFFWEYNYIQLGLLSKNWHNWILEENKNGNIVTLEESSWKTLTEDEVIIDNLKLIPLNSTYLLKEEGREMQHCVGSYDNKCLYDNTHIYSIRTIGGFYLSTLELQLDILDIDKINIIQHKSRFNAEPTLHEKNMAYDFISYLKQKNSMEYFKKIRKETLIRKEQKNTKNNFKWTEELQNSFKQILINYPLLY